MTFPIRVDVSQSDAGPVPVLRCPTCELLYLDKIRFICRLCMCYPGQTTFKLSFTKLFVVWPRAEFNVAPLLSQNIFQIGLNEDLDKHLNTIIRAEKQRHGKINLD